MSSLKLISNIELNNTELVDGIKIILQQQSKHKYLCVCIDTRSTNNNRFDVKQPPQLETMQRHPLISYLSAEYYYSPNVPIIFARTYPVAEAVEMCHYPSQLSFFPPT